MPTTPADYSKHTHPAIVPAKNNLQGKPILLFYCQSSLGIGHTMRSIRLLQGMGERFDVHFVNG